MLDPSGFDAWADEYDKGVAADDRAGVYPFAGYGRVLDTIYEELRKRGRGAMLDIGFGTAKLTKRLFDEGYAIYGIDFSEKMVELAKGKMPTAALLQRDMKEGLPAQWAGQKWNCIVASYAIHHLTDEEKAPFLHALRGRLLPDGVILIGDVAFRTREEWQACRQRWGDAWDDGEQYIVFEELQAMLPGLSLSFTKISDCAAVIAVT